jgi:outer membrane protein OmpA-like peptidoglycan-associated protein
MALPPRPATLKVGFKAKSGSLNAHARLSLFGLSRRLVSGASVTVTGYARRDLKLAKERAESVARYLGSRASIHFILRTSTTSQKHEVIVATASQ